MSIQVHVQIEEDARSLLVELASFYSTGEEENALDRERKGTVESIILANPNF